MAGITQVAQRVEDLDRAVAFYRDVLEMRLVAVFDPPGLAFFDVDGVRLLLEEGANAATLYLGVDDIDATVESLSNDSVEIVSEPHLIFTDGDGVFGAKGIEEWQAFFKDSEGNIVGLVERRSPSEDD